MINDTFIALVGLVLFFVIVVVVGAPGRIIGVLDNRTNRIRGELDEARRSREEAQALLAEYQRKRRDAEAEAEQIVEDARKEAKRLSEEASRKLDEMVERRTKAAEQKIDQAEKQAIAEVRSRAAELAIAAASEILKDKVSGERAASLLDDSIDTVKARLN